MPENTNYHELPLEELLKLEKKLKVNKLISATIIGFLIGVIAFGIFTKGFGFLFIFISLFLIYLINKNSEKQKQSLKDIQNEIKHKSINQ